jgi:adenylate cyclase class 2
MQYEVEQKFPVADLEAVEGRLAALGAEIAAAEEEVDLYFAHPARDFAATDEALRLRQKGPRGYITYKGPKIDAVTKTRREIELPLTEAAGGLSDWRSLLEALGFRPVGEVRKSRRKALVPWQGRRVEVSLDAVEHLGTFVELELMAGAEEVAAARASIAALAGELGLTGGERRSYLELLLQRQKRP